jgi:hypothetical protein
MKKNLLSIFITLFFVFSIYELDAQCVTCEGSTANGQNASVVGPNNQANAINSIVIGQGSTTEGAHSIVLGNFSNTSHTGGNSITIGMFSSVVSGQAMVIGYGYNTSNLLVNNMQQSLMMGFNSNRPTLFVSRSNGLGKTGRIAIGDVVDAEGQMAPQAKLHLRADDGEEAAVFIEPHGWDGGDTAILYLGNKQNSIHSDKTEGVVYTTQENHVFKGGDIYIEDIDKGIIMKSPDGKCWRGKLDNSGSLHFTELDACPGTTVSVTEHKMIEKPSVTVYPNPADNILTVKIERNGTTGYTKLKVAIINQLGTEMMSKYLTATSVGFYTGDLAPGNYFVKITGKDYTTVKRFVKK